MKGSEIACQLMESIWKQSDNLVFVNVGVQAAWQYRGINDWFLCMDSRAPYKKVLNDCTNYTWPTTQSRNFKAQRGVEALTKDWKHLSWKPLKLWFVTQTKLHKGIKCSCLGAGLQNSLAEHMDLVLGAHQVLACTNTPWYVLRCFSGWSLHFPKQACVLVIVISNKSLVALNINSALQILSTFYPRLGKYLILLEQLMPCFPAILLNPHSTAHLPSAVEQQALHCLPFTSGVTCPFQNTALWCW